MSKYEKIIHLVSICSWSIHPSIHPSICLLYVWMDVWIYVHIYIHIHTMCLYQGTEVWHRSEKLIRLWPATKTSFSETKSKASTRRSKRSVGRRPKPRLLLLSCLEEQTSMPVWQTYANIQATCIGNGNITFPLQSASFKIKCSTVMQYDHVIFYAGISISMMCTQFACTINSCTCMYV